MAKARCDCLCSFNHPETMTVCTGHGYRFMVATPSPNVIRVVDLCPKCRALLAGTPLSPLETRAPV